MQCLDSILRYYLRGQVLFHEGGGGSVTMIFFGIKNDTSRSGFEVRIPGGVVDELDPIRALRYMSYMQHTDNESLGVQLLFVSLRPPYAAIKAGTITNILLDAIPCLVARVFLPYLFDLQSRTLQLTLTVSRRLLCKLVTGRLRKCFLIIMCTPGHLPITQTMYLCIRV